MIECVKFILESDGFGVKKTLNSAQVEVLLHYASVSRRTELVRYLATTFDLSSEAVHRITKDGPKIDWSRWNRALFGLTLQQAAVLLYVVYMLLEGMGVLRLLGLSLNKDA